MTTFWLPCPPSVNQMYRGASDSKARFKSRQYKAWLKEAGEHLLTVHYSQKRRFECRVGVLYEFARMGGRNDVFNREKGLSDFLVTHGILADDSLIQEGTVRWVDDIVHGVRVTIEEWTPRISDP